MLSTHDSVARNTVSTPRLIDIQEVRRALAAILESEQVFEVRILDGSFDNSRFKTTLAGYFQNTDESKASLYRQLQALKSFMGVYITPQVCHADLLHRVYQKLEPQQKGFSTSDSNITDYRWLLIDSDPNRISGISSTDRQHTLAIEHSQKIRAYLEEQGFPAPILADSGNGAHLMYRVALTNTPEYADKDTGLIARVLKALDEQFSDDAIKVDTTVGNPARIWKLYGSLARKGSDTPDRPHRMARILEMPDSIEVVLLEQLELIAIPREEIAPAKPHHTYSQPSNRTKIQHFKEQFTLEAFLQKHHIAVKDEDSYEGGTRYHLERCVWNPDHNDNSAVVYQFADGRLGASCSHNSCQGKGWREFRLVFEPDAYTPRLNTPNSAEKPKKKATQDETGGEQQKEETAQQRLTRIAETAHYIVTPANELYARVNVNSHHEVKTINERGSGFRRWLIYNYTKLYGQAPNSEAISQVMSSVQSIAEYEGEHAKVYTRIAYHNGCIYLDLANDKWQCIEISFDGWRVISCPPVYFRRNSGMLPLPLPHLGGSLDELRLLINAKDETDYILISAWLIGALHPTGPYPVLNLNGERGSAKSKATTILRNIIDPNEAPIRNAPKDEREAAIAAQNNMVIALDNLSSMPLWLSDILCRIATGNGFAARALYTDDDEKVFSAIRPIILNGIEDGLITQSDLLSRTMLVTLSPPAEYKTEEEIDDLFRELHPSLLGALLSTVSVALRERRNVRLENKPRMADFATWVTAAEYALQREPGTFLAAYTVNQENASSIITESSPVAKAIMQFMSNHPTGWDGLTGELHTALEQYDIYTKSKGAPKSPNKLSGQLKRIAPSLRMQGIDIQQPPRQNKGSRVVLKHTSSVDTMPKSVDKRPPSVDTFPKSVDKNSLSTRTITPDIASKTRVFEGNSVDSVDKMPSLSTLYPPIWSEKREKEEKADRVENLSTLPTHLRQDTRQLFSVFKQSVIQEEQRQPKKNYLWNAPGAHWKTQYLAFNPLMERVKACLESSDTTEVNAVVTFMQGYLQKKEGLA